MRTHDRGGARRTPARRERRGRAGLPHQAHHARRAVPAGRRQRCARPARVADKMSRPLGQQVVVENRGGAGGTVATARSPRPRRTATRSCCPTPAPSQSIRASIPTSATTRARTSRPIGLIASMPSVLVVHPSVPARTTAELIAYGKANPARSTTPSCRAPSATSPPSCSPAPRASSSPRFPTRDNGDAPRQPDRRPCVDDVSVDSSHCRQRKGRHAARAALTTAERSPLMPEVPPISESGVPGFSAAIRYGLVAPPGTPKPIIEKLNKRACALRWPTSSSRPSSRARALRPRPSTPEEYACLHRR